MDEHKVNPLVAAYFCAYLVGVVRIPDPDIFPVSLNPQSFERLSK